MEVAAFCSPHSLIFTSKNNQVLTSNYMNTSSRCMSLLAEKKFMSRSRSRFSWLLPNSDFHSCKQLQLRTCLVLSASSAAAAPPLPQNENEMDDDVEKRKHSLLRAIQDTQRGLVTTPNQRSLIEEALVRVEKYDAGKPIELGKLNGTWRLQYTSAPDVLILLQSSSSSSSSSFPFFQVGPIYQTFECSSDSDGGGIVRNVVRWSIPNLLEEQEGATLIVTARFSTVSTRNIYLQFDEISVGNIKISEQLQALVAPALLPRSFLSLQILQFIRSFSAQIPVQSSGRQSVGGLYYLSYLDRDMLLGRAGSGGVFVFTKSQPLF